MHICGQFGPDARLPTIAVARVLQAAGVRQAVSKREVSDLQWAARAHCFNTLVARDAGYTRATAVED